MSNHSTTPTVSYKLSYLVCIRVARVSSWLGIVKESEGSRQFDLCKLSSDNTNPVLFSRRKLKPTLQCGQQIARICGMQLLVIVESEKQGGRPLPFVEVLRT